MLHSQDLMEIVMDQLPIIVNVIVWETMITALQKVTNWLGIIVVLKVLLSYYTCSYNYYAIIQYDYFIEQQPALVVDERHSKSDGVSGVCMWLAIASYVLCV